MAKLHGGNGTARPLKRDSGPARETVEPAPKGAPRPDADDWIYLIGRPRLKQFLRFMRDDAVDPPGEERLRAEWRAARDLIRALETSEAGSADHPGLTPIEVNSKYRGLLIELLKDPIIQNNFNTVPTEVAFVELDRMVVYQKHIDLAFVRELQRRLGPAPSDEAVFATCLPYDHPQPPVKWARLDDETYVFVSRSNDIRFLGAMPLKPGQVQGGLQNGGLAGVVGVGVGFGSNFLNAISCENRLILNNGSHRAYALRDLGITRAPCIVQHASTREEFDRLASSEVQRNPDLFLKHPRPSMLKDYFDPRLRKVTPVRRQVHHIEVSFSVREYSVPAV